MTTQPNPQYRQHHDVEPPRVDTHAFRQGWRVVTRLDALFRDGRVTAGQYQAAVEYRQTWERVMSQGGGSTMAQAGAIPGTGRGGDPHAGTVDAVARLRWVEARIGPLAVRLCFLSLVRDLPWSALAEMARRDPHTVRDWTVLAIRALAVAWEGCGPSGRSRRQSHARRLEPL